MAVLNYFLTKVFGSENERTLKKLIPIVQQISALEPEVEKLSDEQLRLKTQHFQEKLANGATLDDLLPEAFAVVREASKRTTGMRHFDVQLIGGIVLHQGKIAEMATGEGKTLVATLPAYLNALTKEGRPYRDGERLSGTPRCRVDGSDLQIPGTHCRYHST